MEYEKRYRVFNRTDGILAAQSQMTRDEAKAFIRGFRKRYRQQGYYLTAMGDRIPPKNVKLLLLDDNWEPVSLDEWDND